MEITEALILKFFRQECTPEERAAVNKYFDTYPDELDKYLDEQGWKDFAEKSALPQELSQKMLEVIEDHIQASPRAKVFPFRIIGIAASILVIAGTVTLTGINLLKTKTTNSLPIAAQKTLFNGAFDTVNNKTDHTVMILLSDSSKVSLSAKSRLIFKKVFDKDKRDVYLYGQAIFKVAKDKTWPFTVYAANLSTTALGTSFKITAFKESGKTVVQLFTGKVVVKQLNTVNGQKIKDVYLTPGYMLEANKTDNNIKVSGFAVNDKVENPTVDATTVIDHDLIIFKNQSLTAVVSMLKKAYHVDIAASPHDIANRYFTGTINSKLENVNAVLSTIARLNSLKLIKQNDTYTLASVKL